MDALERPAVAARWCGALLALGRLDETLEATARAGFGSGSDPIALIRALARARDQQVIPDTHDAPANSLFWLGDWTGALDAARQAQAAATGRGRGTPETARAELRTALLEAWLGRAELALPHAKSAITLLERIHGAQNPDLLGARVLHAQVLTLGGRAQDAVTSLQRALGRGGATPEALSAAQLALATALLRRARVEEAHALLTGLLPTLPAGPRASAVHLLGPTEHLLGRPEAPDTLAEALRERQARSGAGHPLTLLCAANLATARGDREARAAALDALAAKAGPRCPLLGSALP